MTKIKDKYAANIVAHYDFRKGSIADQSGNANDGTFEDAPVFMNSPMGKMLKLDGTNDYVDTGNVFQSTFQDSFTISFWLQPADGIPPNSKSILGSRNVTDEDWVYFSHKDTGKFDFYYESNNSGVTARTANAVFSDGQVLEPKFITLVADSTISGAGGLKVYITGSETSLDAGAGLGGDTSGIDFANWTSDQNLYFGCYNSQGIATAFYPGFLNDLVIWNRALTGQEVSQLYNESLQETAYTKVDENTLSKPERNLVVDGNMEDSGTSAYAAHSSATLSKETDSPHSGTRYLKITYNGVASPGARINDVFTLNNLYRITGWGKSDGTWTPQLNDFTGGFWDGTLSTDWQYFDINYYSRNASSDLLLYHSGQTSGYTAWDDIKIQRISNIDDVYIADGKGWNVSTANVAAGNLENTDWKVSTGSWQVEDSFEKRFGSQLLTNNDFENWTGAVLDDWTIYQNATVTEQTATPVTGSSYVRVAWTDIDNAGIYQSALTVGKNYRVTGWAKTDGTGSVDIYLGGGVINATIDSIGWTYFDVSAEADGTNLYLVNDTNGASYVEFDDVRLYEVKSDSKKISCKATGITYKPFYQSAGTWDFEINPTFDGVVSRVYFIANNPSGYLATTEGYFFAVIGTGACQMYETNGAGGAALKFTSNELFPEGSWTKFRLTRTSLGVFTAYYYDNGTNLWTALTDSGGGAMPFTDLTWTDSNFIFFEAQTSNYIRNFKFTPEEF